MSADFVKTIQTFAAGLDASKQEDQEAARQMIKTLAEQLSADSKLRRLIWSKAALGIQRQ